jgi:hypothetical protein
MPIPLKPCDGHFSEEVQQILQRNIDRTQWADHPCEVCGIEIGAVQVKGKWVPETHWPSVKYRPHGPTGKLTPVRATSEPAMEKETVNS